MNDDDYPERIIHPHRDGNTSDTEMRRQVTTLEARIDALCEGVDLLQRQVAALTGAAS